jgi:hypothetical protein
MEWAAAAFNTAKLKVDGLTGSDIEKLVKDATSNENWGVSGSTKSEIAHYTYDFQVNWNFVISSHPTHSKMFFLGL